MSLNHLLTERGRFETEITIWRVAEDRFFTGSPIARANPDFDCLLALKRRAKLSGHAR